MYEFSFFFIKINKAVKCIFYVFFLSLRPLFRFPFLFSSIPFIAPARWKPLIPPGDPHQSRGPKNPLNPTQKSPKFGGKNARELVNFPPGSAATNSGHLPPSIYKTMKKQFIFLYFTFHLLFSFIAGLQIRMLFSVFLG